MPAAPKIVASAPVKKKKATRRPLKISNVHMKEQVGALIKLLPPDAHPRPFRALTFPKTMRSLHRWSSSVEIGANDFSWSPPLLRMWRLPFVDKMTRVT